MEPCRLVDDDELDRLAADVDGRPPRDLLRRLVVSLRAARHAQLQAERLCRRETTGRMPCNPAEMVE